MTTHQWVRKAERMARRARSYERATRILEGTQYSDIHDRYNNELRHWLRESDARRLEARG